MMDVYCMDIMLLITAFETFIVLEWIIVYSFALFYSCFVGLGLLLWNNGIKYTLTQDACA